MEGAPCNNPKVVGLSHISYNKKKKKERRKKIYTVVGESLDCTKAKLEGNRLDNTKVVQAQIFKQTS